MSVSERKRPVTIVYYAILYSLSNKFQLLLLIFQHKHIPVSNGYGKENKSNSHSGKKNEESVVNNKAKREVKVDTVKEGSKKMVSTKDDSAAEKKKKGGFIYFNIFLARVRCLIFHSYDTCFCLQCPSRNGCPWK